MTKKELLEEAKRRYPIGTKVICLCDGLEYFVGDFDHDGSDGEDVWCNSADGWGVKLKESEIWASLADSNQEEIIKLKQLKPLFVEFEKFCQKTRNIDHVIAMDEQMATGHVQSIRHRTTEELFELWLEQQTKK